MSPYGNAESANTSRAGLGYWLARWRVARGESRAGLARLVGVSPSTIGRLEEGTIWPTPSTWLALAEALGVSAQEATEIYAATETRCARVIALTDACLDRGHIDAARLALGHAQHLNREMFAGRYNGEIYRLLGRVHYAEGNFTAACEWFRRMEQAGKRKGSPFQRGRAAYDYGLALAASRRWEGALQALAVAREQLAKAHALTVLGQAHWATGTVLMILGSYEEALPHYEAAERFLRRLEMSAYPAFGALLCRWALGDRTVLPHLAALAENAPPALRPKVERAVGVMLRQEGRPGDALQWLDKAVAHAGVDDADWAETQAERLLCLCQVGNIGDAREVLAAVAKRQPALDFPNYVTVAVAGLALGAGSASSLRPQAAASYERRAEDMLHWAARPSAVSATQHGSYCDP